MRAVVLRNNRLEVRETADPVPGPGELLIKPLSAAICASDVHYMDHPDSAPRFVWDANRDTIMGHEFIGEVVDHGPECSGDFPLGARVTSMPILIRADVEPLVIGHHPDAPGAFGELMVVSEVMSRPVPDGVSNDAVALVDAFAVGEFYVRCSGIGPGELPLVIGAGAIGLRRRRRWRRAASAPSWWPTTATTGWPTRRSLVPTCWSTPPSATRTKSGGKPFGQQQHSDSAGHLRMRGPKRPDAAGRRLVRVHGAGVRRGGLVRRRHDRLHRRDAQGK